MNAADNEPLLNARKKKCQPRCCGSILAITLFVFLLAVIAFFEIIPNVQHYHPHVNPSSKKPPCPPATQVNSTQVSTIRISWQETACNQTVREYNVTATIVATNHTTQLYAGTRTKFEWHDALANTRYCFRVYAINEYGPSNSSIPQCITTSSAQPASAPPCLFISNASMTTLSINWTTPIHDGGSLISGYLLQYQYSKHLNWIQGCETPSTQKNCTIDNLPSNTTIQVRVAAKTSGFGLGQYNQKSFQTQNKNASLPLPPLQPTLLHVNCTMISIGIDQSLTNNGGPVLNRSLTVLNENNNHSDILHILPCATTTNLTGLSPNTIYKVGLIECTNLGCSSLSPLLNISTNSGTAPTASRLTQVPLSKTSTSLSIEWTQPLSCDFYGVHYEIQRTDWWNSESFHTVNTTNSLSWTTVQPLMPSITYAFRVRAVDKFGTSSWSNTGNFSTLTSGACGDLHDAAAFKANKTTMKKSIQGCLISCALSPHKTKCARDCIVNKVGFSSDCAQCWVDEGTCTIQNCFNQCLNPASPQCAQCSEKMCFPDCVKCSGVPRFYYPP